MSEQHEQFKTATFLREEYPDVLFTSSIAGLKLPKHKGANLTACGYLVGTPDLMIFEARKNYHALFIEMKTTKGKQSKAQKDFEAIATSKGYLYKLAYGHEQAIEIIKDYL